MSRTVKKFVAYTMVALLLILSLPMGAIAAPEEIVLPGMVTEFEMVAPTDGTIDSTGMWEFWVHTCNKWCDDDCVEGALIQLIALDVGSPRHISIPHSVSGYPVVSASIHGGLGDWSSSVPKLELDVHPDAPHNSISYVPSSGTTNSLYVSVKS